MSEENAEIVQRAFEAFNRGGREADASGAILAPDVDWEVPLGLPDFDGAYTGRDAVTRFRRIWFADFAELRLEP